MSIIAYNATCTCGKSAIYKFIVILICLNKMHFIVRCNKLYILLAENNRNNIIGNLSSSLLFNNLQILFDYFICYTQN